jgi:hypothetical protein
MAAYHRVIVIACDMLPKRVGSLTHLRGTGRSMVGRVSHMPVTMSKQGRACHGRISRQIDHMGKVQYLDGWSFSPGCWMLQTLM